MVPGGVYLEVGKEMTKWQQIKLGNPWPGVIMCQIDSLMYLQVMTSDKLTDNFCFVFYMTNCAI